MAAQTADSNHLSSKFPLTLSDITEQVCYFILKNNVWGLWWKSAQSIPLQMSRTYDSSISV